MGAQQSQPRAGSRTANPCLAKLDAYVACMEAHDGKRPDPYEGEWCDAEREAYRECRAQLRKARDAAAAAGNSGGAKPAQA